MNKFFTITLISLIFVFSFNSYAGVQNQAEVALKNKSEQNLSFLDEVIDLIKKRFYDKKYRGLDLEKLREKHKKQVADSKNSTELHNAVNEMIARFGVSHFAVIEKEIYQGIGNERTNTLSPEFGFKLRKLDGKYFATRFSEGGAAESAGLKLGDEIISINSKKVTECKKVIDAGNDVGIPGPEYLVIKAEKDEKITLQIRREKDAKTQKLTVQAVDYNETKSVENSVKVIEKDGKKIAYIHTWHFLSRRIADIFHSAIDDEFADCDAMILDIRGHGGNMVVVRMLLASFTKLRDSFRKRIPKWEKPLIVLIDEGSRSAKEIFAHEIQREKLGTLVGRRTQGAVLATNFYRLSDGSALMLPVLDGARFTKDGKTLEGNGVEPDIVVPLQLEYAAGTDAILERGVKQVIKILCEKVDKKVEQPLNSGEEDF
ncbi:MAG: PDZ domain-containing protein [Planctomycetes bacterium]|nr:PDZ domain-containing protein [Planctomycetota bacterium]